VTCRRGSPTSTRTSSTRSETPRRQIIVPGPLGTGAVGELLAAGSGPRPSPPSWRPAAPRDGSATPLLVRDLAAALAPPTACVPWAAPVAGLVRAVGPGGLPDGRGRWPAQPRRGRRRPRGPPSWGRVAVSDAGALSRASRRRGSRPRPGRSARAEICASSRRSGSCTRSSPTRSSWGSPRGARAPARPAAELLHEREAPAEQVAGHLVRAPRAAAPWVADVLRGRGPDRLAPRRRRERRDVSCAARSTSRRAARRRPGGSCS
jgi:hypothetical protein